MQGLRSIYLAHTIQAYHSTWLSTKKSPRFSILLADQALGLVKLSWRDLAILLFITCILYSHGEFQNGTELQSSSPTDSGFNLFFFFKDPFLCLGPRRYGETTKGLLSGCICLGCLPCTLNVKLHSALGLLYGRGLGDP